MRLILRETMAKYRAAEPERVQAKRWKEHWIWAREVEARIAMEKRNAVLIAESAKPKRKSWWPFCGFVQP